MRKSKQLYILPFDHRSTFYKGLFAWQLPLTKAQVKTIKMYKGLVWQAFLKVYKKSQNKENLGILVDEQFGSKILRQARKLSIVTILTTEKSGQKIFDFEYGENFGKHILKFKPDYAKVLVRYNPSNRKDNLRQLKQLKKINSFCQRNKVGLLFELLVSPTDLQLKKFKTKEKFDLQGRAVLTQKAVKENRAFGIEPDIWKLEAMYKKADWQKIIKIIENKNKKDIKIIVLGRAASKKQVSQWLKIAANFREIIGFAVGRTIFFPPLEKYRDKKISKRQAIEQIAKQFEYFINLWEKFKFK